LDAVIPRVSAAAADGFAQTAEMPAFSPRAQDVELKHRRISEFLEDEGYDAVLLTRQDSFAWATSGGNAGFGTAGDAAAAALFVTRDHRCVLASNVESGRIFEEEIAGLGFQLKESRWYEARERLVEDICHGRRVASDSGVRGTVHELEKLRRLRINLTDLERERYRELGRAVSHAVEATCRNAKPGVTEHEVAAELSHRLLRHGITPVAVYVASDDRASQFRLPIHKGIPIRNRVTIMATGNRFGLCASATRTVCFGAPDAGFLQRHGTCLMIDAAYIYFSQHGQLAAEVLKKGLRIYEKTGFTHEWSLTPQGGVTGYQPCELTVVPDAVFQLRAGMALAWTPCVGDARSGDTVLIDENSFEFLTVPQQWPLIEVSVKGVNVDRPTFLQLPRG
jgi:Xaa-Pro aminopeptidase